MRSNRAGSLGRTGCLRRRLAAQQADRVRVGNDNQAVVKHAFDRVNGSRYFLRGIDDGDHDGQVARDMEEALFVLVTLGAIAEDASINRSAGDLEHTQFFYDGVVERLAVPFVGFTDEDAQQLGRAFATLMEQLA